MHDTLFDILSAFCLNGCAVTVYMTAKHGDAENFARAYSEDFDTVVCVGGDGTLSEAVCGLMRTEAPPTLGYIPMGTTNDMASTLLLPKNAKAAADCVLSGRTIPLDIGRLGENYFAYIAAFGAFTEVSYSTPQENKRTLGHLAYIIEAMTRLSKINAYNAVVEHDCGMIEGSFIFGAVMNSLSVAGVLKLDPANVALSDGYFEVMLIKSPQNLVDLNNIITSVLSQEYDPASVIFLHTRKIRFTFDRDTAWTRDGESGGIFRTVEAENCHQALRITVPEVKNDR
ncbi:MAG: YegS/Rv2252/BmrU family lipid kinase [Clostridia bacterium]|nr:YegS/Rv2252/BmrU family lipid kinase [Clostridia bacterium]